MLKKELFTTVKKDWIITNIEKMYRKEESSHAGDIDKLFADVAPP